MKNKIAKILGVFLTTAIVTSILVSALPVAAKAQDWEKILTPANNGMIDGRVNWVGPIEKAIDGTLYCAVGLGDDPVTEPKTTTITTPTPTTSKVTDPDNPLWDPYNDSQVGLERNEVKIYKSTDNGRSWKETSGQPFNPDHDWKKWPATSPQKVSDTTSTSGVIFDIECSSKDANVIWVTDGIDIWRSSNGGNTWNALDNLFDEKDSEGADYMVIANGYIVSISVGYEGNTWTLYAATSTFDHTINNPKIPVGYTGPTHGGVYSISSRLGASSWVDLEVDNQRIDPFLVYVADADPNTAGDQPGWVDDEEFDVLEVKVLPGHDSYNGVAAVVSHYNFIQRDNKGDPLTGDPVGRTIVTTRFGSSKWGEVYGDVTLRYNKVGGPTYVTAELLSATIWVPSDFGYDDDDLRALYVGIAPLGNDAGPNVEQGDVYLCYFDAPIKPNPSVANVPVRPVFATDLDIAGKYVGTAVTDLDGVGDTEEADILAGGYMQGDTGTPNTWATQDGGNTWIINDKRPTGGRSQIWGTALVSVRVHANFDTNGMAWAGTHGGGSQRLGTVGNYIDTTDVDGIDPNGDAGLSISSLPTDVCAAGFTWNTIWFISTHVTMKVDMAIANDNTIYLTTYWEVMVDGEIAFQLFSAWRYMDTTGDGVRDWERVNSYSLYEVDIDEEILSRFDFVRTTPENSFVMLMDRVTADIFHSVNKGNLWATYNRPFPVEGVTIYSVLLTGARNVMVGTNNVNNNLVYYTRNLGNWSVRDAFGANSSDMAKVTDLRLASNQDILAAAVSKDATAKIWAARSVYSSSNSTYTTWAKARNTGVDAGAWAFIAPANDYATSNFIYVAGSAKGGIEYSTYAATSSVEAADEDAWFKVEGARGSFIDTAVSGDTRYHSNLVTAPGAPGFTAEGNGMTYFNAKGEISSTTIEEGLPVVGKPLAAAGVARVKGRVDKDDTRAAERITDPSNTVKLDGLWLGPASVGSVILYAFGSDCNIWFYEDTLNRPIVDVKVDIKPMMEDCDFACAQEFEAAVQWNTLANVNYYVIIVTVDDPVVNVYDALALMASGGAYASIILPAKTGTTNAALIQNLAAQKNYHVSVWGIKYIPTGTLSGTVSSMAAKATGNSITSFGAGASFTTPPSAPELAAPSAGAQSVGVRPAFQWQPVMNATSYTLTVADNPDFSNPIKSVTTTGTAYGWSASDPVLEYSTTYYWRVVATTPSGNSGTRVNVFTTEQAPPPPQPTPTLIVSIPPAITPTLVVPNPTIIVPTPTVIIPPQENSTPIYIWIIVAVGAVLTIAVIVLIIRTRRVV